MVTPSRCSDRTLVSPARNQSSSCTIDLVCTFLVVTSGKPSGRHRRNCPPKVESVPVPVRSPISTPRARTCGSRSRYCFKRGSGGGAPGRSRGRATGGKGWDGSRQEARALLGRRHRAAVVLAEPAVAVRRDPVVERVADEERHDAEAGEIGRASWRGRGE